MTAERTNTAVILAGVTVIKPQNESLILGGRCPKFNYSCFLPTSFQLPVRLLSTYSIVHDLLECGTSRSSNCTEITCHCRCSEQAGRRCITMAWKTSYRFLLPLFALVHTVLGKSSIVCIENNFEVL